MSISSTQLVSRIEIGLNSKIKSNAKQNIQSPSNQQLIEAQTQAQVHKQGQYFHQLRQTKILNHHLTNN